MLYYSVLRVLINKRLLISELTRICITRRSVYNYVTLLPVHNCLTPLAHSCNASVVCEITTLASQRNNVIEGSGYA